jgi:hypothetical protein
MKRAIFVALMGMSSAAMAESGTVVQTDGNNVVAIEHLFSDDRGCHPGGELAGTVVDRRFPEMGTVPNAFVLEDSSGNRTFINVPNYPAVPRVQASWVAAGLNTFLKKGVAVIAGVKSCGNGPIIMLDSLRAAHRD